MKNGQRKSLDPLNKFSQSFKTYHIMNRGSTVVSQKQKKIQNRRTNQYYDNELQKNQKVIFYNPLNNIKIGERIINIVPNILVPIQVSKGNNSQLVKSILLKRKNVIVVDQNQDFKFKWHPTNGNFRFQKLSNGTLLFNHYQYHRQITNKQLMTRNLSYHCQKKRINLYQIIPPTFILNLSDLNFDINNAKFVHFYNYFKPANIYASKIILNIKRNIPSKMSISNLKPPNYKPNSCLFTDNSYIWLLKPTSLNRGRGIHVFQNLQQVQNLINEYNIGKTIMQQKSSIVKDKIKSHSFIIQKYIQKPLLIKNRKFDLRVWVLVDHLNNVYFYKEGYARTSSQKYSLDENGFKNDFIHLTNNAIQKKGKNYGKNESGNQLSFSYLNDYLKQLFGKGFEFNKIILKMKEIIKLVFESIQKKLNCNNRKYCYELFGFDFMIDQSCKLWLIEINTNPCLELSSQLLEKIIPKMLNDTFRLTFDKIFNVQQMNQLNQINGWQKIYEIA